MDGAGEMEIVSSVLKRKERSDGNNSKGCGGKNRKKCLAQRVSGEICI